MYPNKDVARRAELLGIDPETDSFGGIQRFEGLSVENLKKLVEEGFTGNEDQQNMAPNIGEFIEFAEGLQFPVTFHGYAVSPDRGDYRVSVEGLEANVTEAEDVAYVMSYCRGADELNYNNGVVYAWWD